MNLTVRLSTLVFSISLFFITPDAFSQDTGAGDTPVEIVVEGKQPGPPLWQVRHGDNTLWIFAWLSPIPKNIEWDSARVARVIDDSTQYIMKPEADVSVSPLVMFNPLNIFRGIRLGKRLTRNENDASLQEVLPPQLYGRFSALKSRYFPKNKKIEKVRPLVAGGQMTNLIQNEAGLVPADDIGKKIKRLTRRNKNLDIIEIKYELQLEGGFKDIASRMETLMANLSPELELSCFERQLSRMEEDLDEIRYRAAAWAQGYINEFRYIPLQGDADDDCTRLIATSSEQATYEEISGTLNNQWLDAAESALINHQSAFAVLDIAELLNEDGLLAKLQARGYEVIVP